MPWRPLPRIAFGVCTYPFAASSPADLPLEIGDELYIIEQGGRDGEWYRGYLVAPPSLLAGLTSVKGQTLEARVFSGIFPRVCVEVREVLGDERTKGASPANTGAAKERNRAKGELPVNGEAREVNGMPTPNGSSSPGSSPTSAVSSKGNAEADGAHLSVGKAMKSATVISSSRQTVKSDSSQLILPLSPLSLSSRDPGSPRPPAPVPMLKIGDETPTSAQEPLVDEIASCLREWHSTKLHELLLSRHYGKLDKMSTIVQRLDTDRRQLLHKVLTDQELKSLRESAVWDLVNGNKMLSGEVIVRNPQQRGRILTGDDSAIEITRLQSMMSLLNEKPIVPTDEHIARHLYVGLPDSLGELTAPRTIAIHLCNKMPGQPLLPVSEVHAINVSAASGMSSDGNMRTLFVDLGAADMGEGAGAGSTLWLAFKIIVNEPLRSPQVASASRTSTSSGRPELAHSGSVRGRRSVMFGSTRSRKDTEGSDISPQDSMSDGRKSVGNEGRPPTRESKTVKRTVAAGLIRVDHILKQDLEIEQEVALWTPAIGPVEEQGSAEGNWEALLSELLPSQSGDYKKYSFPKPMKVVIKAFADNDADALIRRTPTWLQNISQTRKMGFSGAPNKPRSDIYLTLTDAFLPRHAFLSHPKTGTVPLGAQQGLANLQLTLEVRRSTGQRIENCIFPSCNSQGHTAWRTTAVERGEPWNLTIRLAIAPEDVPGSHVVMSIADLPGFPFALCWMPLWDDNAFIRDNEHVLALYQYDEYTSSIISGRGAYLALPWEAEKGARSEGPLAALNLRTYLCSTKYSQDPNLLGLLKWQSQPAGEVPSLLSRFAFVPEIEIVKLLNEVFDALFEILVDAAGSEEYETLVFKNLVFVLGIVHDRRFKLAPLVDQYAEKRFRFPAATPCLIRSFKRLLANPTDTETSRELRATFKVGAHIFRFIAVGRAEQIRKKAQTVGLKSNTAFLSDMKGIFRGLHDLMRNPAPILVGTKTLVVQHFHSWLPELVGMMMPEEVLSTAIDFVDSCSNAQGKLILYRLVLIKNISQLDIFKLPEVKKQLRVTTIRWLAPYWGKTEMITDQWREQVRLCCSVVASQVAEFGEEACEHIPKLVDSYRALQSAPRTPRKALSLLFPGAYPFQTKPLAKERSDFDEAMVEIAAVLASITSLPISLAFDFPREELAEFLFSALQVYISILDGEAYPPSWLSVHIYHHRSTMRSLEKLSSILIDTFLPHPDEADQFNTELWRAFFDALIKLIGSDALALETFPEQKRRAVWKIAGDVRELGADLLRRTWEAIGWETSPEDKTQYGLEKLGGYQVQYVPGLVGPIVELCLSVHEGLRRVAIQVMQTMIISEWTLSQDLSLIQAEIIDCLDQLFMRKTQAETLLQKMFIGELIERFDPISEGPEDALFIAVKNLVATVDELLDLLAAVHSSEGNGEIFRIMDTLNLMDFLKDMQKEDIFIRYVHQLADLQASSKNYTEAGLALRLHADLYDWDPSNTVEELRDPFFPAQTAFDRKEQLYFQMIKYYEDGQSWDNALGSYMELADQYEHNVFDFGKLARTQRAMATIYESIGKGQRENPRYFRCIYKGFGFPPSLRDKEFIFQGLATDHMSTFVDRLQEQHPSAQVSTAGSIGEDLEGQYIYVYNVSAQRDLTHPIFQRAKVSQSVRDYYLLSRPNTFTHTTRRKISDVGVKNQSLEKAVFTTAEAFPTILRRSEIISQTTVTLGPLQIAIERTTRKAAELLALEKKVQDGEDTALSSLTDALMLAVDPDSVSSVSHYRQLIVSEDEGKASSDLEDEDEVEEAAKPLDPMENALRIALLDYAMAVKRCLTHYSRPAHQATRADLQQRFEITFGAELKILASSTALGFERPNTSATWDSNNPNGGDATTSVLIQAKSPSPIDRISPKASKQEKKRFSFLKRTSMQEAVQNAAGNGMTKTNGRPSVDVGGHSSQTSQANGSTPANDRSGAMSPSSQSEDKLQKYFGIPESQYQAGPTDLKREKHARGASNHVQSQTPVSYATTSPVQQPNVAISDYERPSTRQSNQSTQGTGASPGAPSLGSRVGSVKKRLSMLGIGKKASKTSVRSRGQPESLIEE
ncbi:uncharacterized protein PV09_02729 [Verruconis gallopava]|uniref:SH3 domain-containing protein n=1 Tax=Verruconis gallopava TaxID=253628 RepID=A0A0D1YZX6_9PEZI|nr:uncharacterized protein PV09_02729 [Verruconis gallopava]KIW06257.1 hypothetical protein PV09_02729 [Verruconis gallopava]